MNVNRGITGSRPNSGEIGVEHDNETFSFAASRAYPDG